MKSLSLLIVTASSTPAAFAASSFISPVGITSTGGYDQPSLIRMIDGSGLTVFDQTGTHGWEPDFEWQGIGESGTLTIDLGEVFTIDGFYLWNQETDNGAVDEFSLVLYDDLHVPAYSSGSLNASIGMPQGATPAQFFALPATDNVRFIDLQIIDLHPTTINRTVIHEVGFSGIPEPSSGLLSVAGALGLSLRRLRRT